MAPAAQPPSLRRPVLWLLAGAAILPLAVGLALHDLANANRPHELEKAPWVALLAAAAVGSLVAALRGLLRRLRRAPTPGAGLLVFVAVPLLVVAAWVCLGAVGTLPDVLGS